METKALRVNPDRLLLDRNLILTQGAEGIEIAFPHLSGLQTN